MKEFLLKKRYNAIEVYVAMPLLTGIILELAYRNLR